MHQKEQVFNKEKAVSIVLNNGNRFFDLFFCVDFLILKQYEKEFSFVLFLGRPFSCRKIAHKVTIFLELPFGPKNIPAPVVNEKKKPLELNAHKPVRGATRSRDAKRVA